MNNNTGYPLLTARVLEVAAGCYPTYPNCPDKVSAMLKAWATMFTEEQISDKHVQRGLYWMRRDSSQTMPTPGKFLEWTKIAIPGEAQNDTVMMPKPLTNKNKQLENTIDRKTARLHLMNILTELTVND